MSNMNQPGAGIFTALVEILGDTVTMASNARLRRLARRTERIGEEEMAQALQLRRRDRA